MPGYKGHLIGGFIAYGCALSLILLYTTSSLLTIVEWLLFTLIGSLFPDIDIKSKGQKLFYWVILVLIVLFIINKYFEGLAMVSVLAMLPLLGNHRGLFHTLWFVVLFPAVLAYLISLYFPLYANAIAVDACCFILGAVSHIWLDFGFYRMIRRW